MVQNNPKVSVIIPVYNTEKYLRECLDSVVNQTLKDIEIVCVDDGSTDESPSILHEYANADTRFRVLTQPNSGSGIARNNAIRAAAGEYVAFIDSDDLYPEEETLEKLYSAASSHSAKICGGSFSSFNTSDIQTKFDKRKLWGYTFEKDGEISYADYQFDYGYHRFLYHRAFLLDNNLLFPTYLRFQDPPFFVRAMIHAGKFYAIHDVTYRYRYCGRHVDIAASKPKTRDLIFGLTDDILMAKEHNLDRLYKLTVLRCREDYWKVLKAAEGFEDEEIHQALKNLNQAIDLRMINEKTNSVIDKLYALRKYDSVQQKLTSAQKELTKIQSSQLYRVGRSITWLPRKLRGGIRCYRDHGMEYTMKYAKERFIQHLTGKRKNGDK